MSEGNDQAEEKPAPVEKRPARKRSTGKKPAAKRVKKAPVQAPASERATWAFFGLYE